jgi:hypothetical protein
MPDREPSLWRFFNPATLYFFLVIVLLLTLCST